MSCWGRGTGGDDSGIKAAEVPKTASVSPSAEQARGCQLGPRPGLAHGCNWSWGSVDVPPPPPPSPPSRCASKVSARVTSPPSPAACPGSRAPIAAPRLQLPLAQSHSATPGGLPAAGTHRLPGPSRGFGLGRKRGGSAGTAPPPRGQ